MKHKLHINLELLERLYYAYSPSRREYAVQAIVRQELNRLKIPFSQDKDGNIFRIVPKQPLLSSHMDMVTFSPIMGLSISKGIIKATNKTNLGADDKNGVFIALSLLSILPNIGFCFSVNEESGGGLWGSGVEDALEKKSKRPAYALIFDRRGNSDIIGASNDYCSEEFEDAVISVIGKHGYKPAIGTFSDADFFNDYVNSVNLSCGYYHAHTDKEYSNINDIKKAIQAGYDLILAKDQLSNLAKPEKDYYSNWRKYYDTTSYKKDKYADFYRNFETPLGSYDMNCICCGKELSYKTACYMQHETYCGECYDVLYHEPTRPLRLVTK